MKIVETPAQVQTKLKQACETLAREISARQDACLTCGRGEWVTAPPMPIGGPFSGSIVDGTGLLAEQPA